MALQQNINIPVGTDLSFKYTDFEVCIKKTEEILENAYIKINNQHGDKNKIFLNVGFYDKKEGTCVFVKNYEFIPLITEISDNFIKQGYQYLKTLLEYADAVDC